MVERHYDLLMRLLRQDKQRGSAESVARIGSAYEALNRLDQAAQGVRPTDDRIEIDLSEEIEVGDDELTIDFENVTEQAPSRPATASPFGKKPYETYNPEVAKSGQRLRRLAQMAILFFGAAVIVLVLYIVQLESLDVETPAQGVVAQSEERTFENTEPERMPLSFSDGSSKQLEESDQIGRLAKFDKELDDAVDFTGATSKLSPVSPDSEIDMAQAETEEALATHLRLL